MSFFFPILMLFTFSYSVVILLHWYGWTKKIKRHGVAIIYSASIWGLAIVFLD